MGNLVWDPDIYGREIGKYGKLTQIGTGIQQTSSDWLLSTLATVDIYSSLVQSTSEIANWVYQDLLRSSSGIANWIQVIQIKVDLLRLLIHQLRQGKPRILLISMDKHSQSSWKRSSLGPAPFSVKNPVQISVHSPVRESSPESRVQLLHQPVLGTHSYSSLFGISFFLLSVWLLAWKENVKDRSRRRCMC